ncbi:site-specific DNA-methyltransferase [Candidatus Poriferisodalis sp.]|uniref:site-specific DNA-methyltransferase n=1 Tax=Candidatus Poriferisodalis sp. TaxID=3101277 RepID=UPI003B0275F3
MPTLEFKGKAHVYAHHLTVPYRPLLPDLARSHGQHAGEPDDNLIIHGDNLEALKALLPRFAGRINCVYIDPPYNTGKEGWVYNDNVNSPLMREWLERNGIVDGEDLERHDKWLCMMWPRLQLLKQLLADDGIIFISIDDNEQHHLRLMLDEIFGEANLFATLSRRAMHTVRNSSKDFNLNTDYVHVYALDKEWWGADRSRYIRVVRDKTDKYPHDDGDGRGPYKLDPLHARNFYETYTHTFGNGQTWSAPSGSYPRYSQDTLSEMEQNDELDFSGTEPRAKRYLIQVQEGQPPDTFLEPELVGFNKDGTSLLKCIFGIGGVFSQPKPIELIQHLLDIVRKPDAVVLDSFAGSGTTAHAVLALNHADGGNRKFIMVECEDYADTITAERVRRVIDGTPNAKDETLRSGLGGSFTYCTLGEPIDAEDMLTGESLPEYSDLAAHLLYVSCGITLREPPSQVDGEPFYSDDASGTDYYLIYRPDIEWLRSNEAMLFDYMADSIARRGNAAVVFAAGKYITQRDLTHRNITFCQLPYELHRGE